jgi:peptidoglycan-associated lipoprotein
MQRSLIIYALLAAFGALAGCGPDYPKCNKDKDCKEKEFCVNGMCQMCRDATDCQKGEICNKGRCEPGAKACTDDSQCGVDQSCIDGVCKACASDDQCGAGGKCQKGRCQRAPAGAINTGEDKPQEPGPCALEPVYFDFNESVLSTDATSAVERNAECIKKAGSKIVTLVGRTDPRGTEEYNLALSDKRAQSVRERLQRLGADGGHLKTVAKGELDATGTDESGWVKDRRVDVQW